ncbi:hypothetical protein D1872_206730 [compost metagenome]
MFEKSFCVTYHDVDNLFPFSGELWFLGNSFRLWHVEQCRCGYMMESLFFSLVAIPGNPRDKFRDVVDETDFAEESVECFVQPLAMSGSRKTNGVNKQAVIFRTA